MNENNTTLRFEYYLVNNDEEVDLYKEDTSTLDGEYHIFLHGTSIRLGYIEYINGNFNVGNIGYEILSKYRGHNYAYKSAILLFKYLYIHGVSSTMITAYDSNIPSIRTMEKLTEKEGIDYKIVQDNTFRKSDLIRFEYIFNEKLLGNEINLLKKVY